MYNTLHRPRAVLLSMFGSLIPAILVLLMVFGCKREVTSSIDLTSATDNTLNRADVNKATFDEIHRKIYLNPSEARIQALKSLDSAGSDNPYARITLLKHIGSSFVFETNYPEGIRYYNEALEIAKKLDYKLEIANINNNMGVIFNEIGNYKLSYMHLIEALNFFDQASVPEKKAAAYNNIGIVFQNLKNYTKALDYFNKALSPVISPGDTILTVSVINNIALCHISLNNYEDALNDLNRAIALSEKVNNQYGLCISYQLKGNLYQSLNKNDEALEAYHVSTLIAQEANLTYQLAMAELGTARVLLKQNKAEEAFKISEKVMSMADTLNSLVLKSDAHELLSDISEQMGNYRESLLNYREHIKTQEDIISQTVIHQIYDVELDYLDQLNKMQKLELEKKELALSNKNTLLFFVSLTFVLLITGLYLVYQNHRHSQEVRLQKTIVEWTEKKSNAALEAEIRERKRIGQELHDSLGHLLSLAGLHVSMQNRNDLPEAKKKELNESLVKIIDDAFDEVRNISHNLAPSLLSESGLKGALKSIADRVNQSTGVKMTYDIFGLNGKTDELIENILFRTIQEIVNNTIKHASASRLFIQITQGNNEISLMAEDDGKGFNYEEVSKHASYGLAHMKSRIENLNGTMFIDSAPGRGTIINILIPVS
jgi:two-component system NarL family sensor kinase